MFWANASGMDDLCLWLRPYTSLNRLSLLSVYLRFESQSLEISDLRCQDDVKTLGWIRQICVIVGANCRHPMAKLWDESVGPLLSTVLTANIPPFRFRSVLCQDDVMFPFWFIVVPSSYMGWADLRELSLKTVYLRFEMLSLWSSYLRSQLDVYWSRRTTLTLLNPRPSFRIHIGSICLWESCLLNCHHATIGNFQFTLSGRCQDFGMNPSDLCDRRC